MSSHGRKIWSLDFSRTGAVPRTRREKIRGIEFNVGLSPFNVPMQITVSFDESHQRLTVAFEYPTSEPERSVCDHEDKHVVIYVGERSARVERIEVVVDDGGDQPIDKVKLNLVAQHVEEERARAPEEIRDNYSVVAQSLRSDALAEALATA